MPTYEYICDSCAFNFETEHSMNQNYLTECPHCLEEKLRLVFGTPYCYAYGDMKTLGDQASKNRERLSSDDLKQYKLHQKEARRELLKNAKPPKGGNVLVPKGNSDRKPLDLSNFTDKNTGQLDNKKVREYIEHGCNKSS